MINRIRLAAVIIAVILSESAAVYGEYIFLKTGEIKGGQIVSETASSVTIFSSIMGLYNPDRGFTGYAPLELNPVTCGYWYIPGAENFDVVSFRIYTITESMFSDSEKAFKCMRNLKVLNEIIIREN